LEKTATFDRTLTRDITETLERTRTIATTEVLTYNQTITEISLSISTQLSTITLPVRIFASAELRRGGFKNLPLLLSGNVRKSRVRL
jgi:hypothetical protein